MMYSDGYSKTYPSFVKVFSMVEYKTIYWSSKNVHLAFNLSMVTIGPLELGI